MEGLEVFHTVPHINKVKMVEEEEVAVVGVIIEDGVVVDNQGEIRRTALYHITQIFNLYQISVSY